MSNEKTVIFTTFGPNRGLSLKIGDHNFIEGVCEVPEPNASSTARVLCRYYDVCYSHELETKIAEYDEQYGTPVVAGDDPIINKANTETAKANSNKKAAADKTDHADKTDPSESGGGGGGDAEKEPASNQNGKKKGN